MGRRELCQFLRLKLVFSGHQFADRFLRIVALFERRPLLDPSPEAVPVGARDPQLPRRGHLDRFSSAGKLHTGGCLRRSRSNTRPLFPPFSSFSNVSIEIRRGIFAAVTAKAEIHHEMRDVLRE